MQCDGLFLRLKNSKYIITKTSAGDVVILQCNSVMTAAHELSY